ncbi:MAG: CotH kinase family protein, partial [Planctomycetes bacterium]|nr:CotH kinase family protein [Planctomycetota bacterium]
TSWIDHGIVEQIGNDSDAFWGSYFVHKDRNGKVHSGPPWDFDRSFQNNGGDYTRDYDVWRTAGEIFGKWHQKLQENLEYRVLLADRWFEHRETVLNTAQTMAYIDEVIVLITEARSRPKKTYLNTFEVENNLFKSWITNRLDWLDGYIAGNFAEKPPIFSPVGGYINSGDSISMSNPSGVSGTIYYTLNGEDPRLEGGGTNSNAAIYTGGDVLTTEDIVDMSSAIWKYLYDGSDQGTAWRTYGFNDDSWGSGPGQLGFGDGDETTDIGPKVSGRRTAYFRHKFTVSNVSEITDMSVNLLYDDGAVVYINDQEVDRIYMPTGTIYYDTLSDGTGGDNATTVFAGIDPSILIEGDNILAVEVHQDKDNSSDISFDLGMEITITISASSQIDFDKSTSVKARINDGGDWSAMNTENYAVSPVLENLRITELMYHPIDPTQAEIDALEPDPIDEDFEFIELKNIGGVPINLNLVHFTDGIDFTFGDYTLAAGEYAVLVKDQAAFAARYSTSGINIVPGSYLGSLDNDGEEIVLRDAIDAEIYDFDYSDDWYELTDGMGYSLTLFDPANPDLTVWDAKAGWRSSLNLDGTPGLPSETVLAADSIVVNELLAHSHLA